MALFETIIALLAISLLLTGAARRLGAPYPAFLALLGVGLAFVPGAPHASLDPSLALALFLAPLLVDAGFEFSVRDLRANLAPVLGLVVGAVAATTVAVACVAMWADPQLPAPAAFALGAIVAPPDAVAAAAVLSQLRPPRRLVAVLESESLLNDASALILYRLAVAGAGAGFVFWKDAPPLLASVPASIAAGVGYGYASMFLSRFVTDAPTAILTQFVNAFFVWMAAERLGLSGVLTTVAFAATVGRISPRQAPARLRIPSNAVWETAAFFLNVLAFVLIGLQIGPILSQLDADNLRFYFFVASAVLACVIATRFLWVFGFAGLGRLYARWRGYSPLDPAVRPTFRHGLLVSWCGMRGLVTLATALALPESFPRRDLILFCAFFVVLGTLTLQGLTLAPLLRLLRLPKDTAGEAEAQMARLESLRAALASLDGVAGEAADRVRNEFRELISEAAASHNAFSPVFSTEDALYRRAIGAARGRILQLRQSGEIGETTFHLVEARLDRVELSLDDK